MAKGKKKFIKAATANAHGQFKAKAEAAGETTKEFAKEKENAPGVLGKEARLAETLMKVGKHRHNSDGTDRHTRSALEVRQAMYGKEKN